jgi:DNA-binding ferritin-like protein
LSQIYDNAQIKNEFNTIPHNLASANDFMQNFHQYHYHLMTAQQNMIENYNKFFPYNYYPN